MTRDQMKDEAALLDYVRFAFDAAAKRGIAPLDLAPTMLIQSAAVVRCREGSARFVEIMERATNLLDDEAAADDRRVMQ